MARGDASSQPTAAVCRLIVDYTYRLLPVNLQVECQQPLQTRRCVETRASVRFPHSKVADLEASASRHSWCPSKQILQLAIEERHVIMRSQMLLSDREPQ